MIIKFALKIVILLLLMSGCYTIPISEADKMKADIYPILNSEQKNEIDELESVHNIQEFINEFWKNTDPFPETENNELADEYNKRLEYVRIHYNYKIGWGHSDRARVYLIYGQPDNIQFESWQPNQLYTGPDIKAIEIWTYESLAPYDNFPNIFNYYDSHLVTFIFADFVGCNRYFQIYSNIPGEISNPNFFPSFQYYNED